MARTFTSAWHKNANAVSAPDPILVLLQFDHADLGAPIRVANNTEDVVSNGDTYTAAAFTVALPDDRDAGLPRAALAFDNVGSGPSGNSLASFLEANDGGRGTTVTLRLVRHSAPDTVEYAVAMQLTDVRVTLSTISGQLGFEDILNRPAVARRYDPQTAPGLY